MQYFLSVGAGLREVNGKFEGKKNIKIYKQKQKSTNIQYKSIQMYFTCLTLLLFLNMYRSFFV